jgi:uncharacterized membrane protein
MEAADRSCGAMQHFGALLAGVNVIWFSGANWLWAVKGSSDD